LFAQIFIVFVNIFEKHKFFTKTETFTETKVAQKLKFLLGIEQPEGVFAFRDFMKNLREENLLAKLHQTTK